MVKKLILAIFIAAMGAVSACSDKPSFTDKENMPEVSNRAGVIDPFGKYKDPVVLHVANIVDPSIIPVNGETPTNNVWKTVIKDMLNIDIKIAWQVSKDNYDQKMSLAISSNELPDAMIVNHSQLKQMVKAGELADLTEAYNQFASPAMKRIIDSTNGLALSQATFDGKLMAIPSVFAEDFNMLWIRQDWLDRLGLKPPKTVDELENVAKAFVEQDPDGNGRADTFGLAGGTRLFDDFSSTSNPFDFTPIFSAYNAYPGFWLKGIDGKPVYGSTLPETKIALAKLRELYSQGLLDTELGIRSTAEEIVINGKAGMFFCGFYGGYWPLPSAWKNDPQANWQAYALPLDKRGRYNIKLYDPINSFLVVRKGFANPEAPVKMNNLYLRDEFKYGTEFMMSRNFFAPPDEIGFEAKAVREVLSGAAKPEDYSGRIEYKLLPNTLNTIKHSKMEPYDDLDIAYWNREDNNFRRAYSLLVGGKNHLDPNLNKIRSLSYTRTKAVESKWAGLSKLERETFLKIIMGVVPLDSFDQFVKDWKKQGGDQLIAEIMENVSE